jgi:lipopolysaccharide transport system ATP-binding protein
MDYANAETGSSAAVNYRNAGRRIGDQYAQLLAADIRNEQGARVAEVEVNESFSVRMEYRIAVQTDFAFVPNFHFYREDGSCAFVVHAVEVKNVPTGEYVAECFVPGNFMNDGVYSVGLALSSFESGVSVHFFERSAIMFNIRDPIEGVATRPGYSGAIPGAVRPLLNWTVQPLMGS